MSMPNFVPFLPQIWSVSLSECCLIYIINSHTVVLVWYFCTRSIRPYRQGCFSDINMAKQGSIYIKKIVCPISKTFNTDYYDFREHFSNTDCVWFRRKLCPNPLARLATLPALGCHSVAYLKPWPCRVITQMIFSEKLPKSPIPKVTPYKGDADITYPYMILWYCMQHCSHRSWILISLLNSQKTPHISPA